MPPKSPSRSSPARQRVPKGTPVKIDAKGGLNTSADPDHQQDGMPAVEGSPGYAMPFIVVIITGFLGLAFAYAIYTYGATEKYAANIAKVVAAEQGYTFAAAVVLGVTIRFVNFYPMVHKGMIMLSKSKNLRSNPFIYKAIGAGAAEHTVVFDDDGHIGKYNRANRSIHHMVENFGALLAGLFLAGTVFPFPVFVCVCAFCIGRVTHQVGYTTGYGGHGIGFMVSTIASVTLEGMLALVAMKTLM